MCFPAFIPQKQESAAALVPGAALGPDLKWEEHRDFLPELTPEPGIRQWYRTGIRNPRRARWHSSWSRGFVTWGYLLSGAGSRGGLGLCQRRQTRPGAAPSSAQSPRPPPGSR